MDVTGVEPASGARPSVRSGSRAGWLGSVEWSSRKTLAERQLWPIALAGFLARGGILVILASIVPLPSAVGLANLIGPTAITAAGLTSGSVAALVGIAGLLVVMLVGGTAIGAATDAVLADAGSDPPTSPRSGPPVRRLTAIRLVSYVPLWIVLALAARPIFDALYIELTAPTDVAPPLTVRVVRAAAAPVAAILVTWFVIDVLGGIAVRIAVARDASVAGSIGGSFRYVVRRPLASLATAALAFGALVVALGPALIGSALAWSTVRQLVAGRAEPLAIGGAMVLLVAVWLGGLALVAIASTWRGLLWTAEVCRTAH